MGRITPADIAVERNRRLKKVTAAPVLRYWNLLQHAFEIAMREWSPDMRNPSKAAKPPSAPLPRERRLSDKEVERPREAFEETRKPWLEPLLFHVVDTVIRQGKLLQMKWSDMGWEREHIFAENAETRKASFNSAR